MGSIEFLLAAIERPVCFSEAAPPIFGCSQFNVVCATCRAGGRLAACPICRERFGGEAPRSDRFAEERAVELANLRARLPQNIFCPQASKEKLSMKVFPTLAEFQVGFQTASMADLPGSTVSYFSYLASSWEEAALEQPSLPPAQVLAPPSPSSLHPGAAAPVAEVDRQDGGAAGC